MTDAEPRRPRDAARTALMVCAVYYCFLGLALLVADVVSWGLVGTYESPSLLGLYALRWLAVPGVALAGGAAMVAGSCRPARPWAFLLALVMLIVYIWCWDMAQFLTGEP